MEKPNSENKPNLLGAAEIFTPAELAQILKVSRVFVYKLVERGALPFFRIGEGKVIRFSRSEIEAWLEKGRGRPWHRDKP